MTQSLTRIYLQVLLILLLCIGGAGYAGYLLVDDILLASYQERAAQTSRVAADHINDQLSEHKKTLEVMARQPDVVSLLQRGTPTERERKQDELRSMLPGAVMVYLLARNSAGDLSSAETLDPACRDFIRGTATAGMPPAPEFHELGAPAEHYDMATTVRDESQKPVGYLLVKFSLEPLRTVIGQALPPGGHMQLRQAVAGRPAQTVLAFSLFRAALGA